MNLIPAEAPQCMSALFDCCDVVYGLTYDNYCTDKAYMAVVTNDDFPLP